MKLVVAIFAGLWFWFASGCWGYTFHYVLKQPLVMALPFGILMGDIPTAMIIGATIELVYVGMISPGANIPADECFAGVISIPLALLAGLNRRQPWFWQFRLAFWEHSLISCEERLMQDGHIWLTSMRLRVMKRDCSAAHLPIRWQQALL